HHPQSSQTGGGCHLAAAASPPINRCRRSLLPAAQRLRSITIVSAIIALVVVIALGSIFGSF
ncbi:MAG: hypothetical protein WAJ91_02375, partial [Rhodoplanes sp.]